MSTVHKVDVLLSGDATDLNNKLNTALDSLSKLDKAGGKDDGPDKAKSKWSKAYDFISTVWNRGVAIGSNLLEHNFQGAFQNIGALAGDVAKAVGSMWGKAGEEIGAKLGAVFEKLGAWIGAIFDKAFSGIEQMALGGKLADRLGITTEQFAALELAGRKSGLGQEEMGAAVKHLSKNLTEAATAGGPVAGVLQLMGLNARELIKKDIAGQIQDITEALAKVPNASQKSDFAQQIFGKSGDQLLDLKPETLKKANADAERLGLSFSQGQADQARAVKRAWGEVGQALDGLWRTMGKDLGPIIEWIGKKLTDAVIWVRQMWTSAAMTIKTTYQNIGEIIDLVIDSAAFKLTEWGNTALHLFTDVLPQALRSLWEQVKSVFAGDWSETAEKEAKKIAETFRRPRGAIEQGLMDDLDRRAKKVADAFEAAKKAGQMTSPKTPGALLGDSLNASPRGAERGSAEAMSIIATARRSNTSVPGLLKDVIGALKEQNRTNMLIEENTRLAVKIKPSVL